MFEEEFARVPVEPPRRVESLPGLRLKGAIPRWAIILPLFFVCFFLFIPLSIMNSDPAMRLATGAGETVQAHVVSTSSASACRGAASRRVVYVFTSKSGREYRGAGLLCEESSYYLVKEGDAIEVRYLRSDPTVNRLATEGGNQPPFAVFLFMPFFFLAFFGAMFWPPIGAILKARQLFKSGRIATGKVIFVKKRANFLWPGMPGSGSSSVYLEMQSSSGVSREVVAPCQNDWLTNQLVPGAMVHVAYKDDKATQVALLDAYLR
jgi:hypothetical protein